MNTRSAILLLLLLTLPTIWAYDVELSPVVSDMPQDRSIAHLFRIENLDYEQGEHYEIDVNLSYELLSLNESTNGTSHHTINKYTTNTVGFEENSSWVYACGEIVVENDTNLSNNIGCWNISSGAEQGEELINISQNITNETIEINNSLENMSEDNSSENLEIEPADCSNMSITGAPLLVQDGERILYRFEEWQSGDEVEYWIEDLFGEEIKSSVRTSSSSSRSYTPRIKKAVEVYIIKALRYREGCQDDEEETLVIIQNPEYEEKEEQGQEDEEEYENEIEILEAPKQVVAGESFELEMLISKEDNRRRVISIELGSSKSKVYLSEKGEYEIILPIVHEIFCEGERKEEVLIEGMGIELATPLVISPAQCPEEEMIIQEEKENPVKSIYVRAQNYQEEINIYGTSQAEELVVLKEEGKILGKGPFSQKIKVQKGENTVYVVAEEEGELKGQVMHFYLNYDEDDEEERKEEENNSTNTTEATTTLTGYHIFEGGTQEIEIKKEQDYTAAILVSTTLVLGVFFIWFQFKRKDLSRTRHPSTSYGKSKN